jgi:hypothetical protein
MKMRIAARLLRFISIVLILIGSALTLWGALQPWIMVKVFKTIDLAIPGLFFVAGMWCVGLASLILTGLRRSPLVCVIAVLILLHLLSQARVAAPERAKYQMLGAQLTLSPVNRLLNQFNYPDIDVTNWSVKNPDLLGPGIDFTEKALLVLLAGSLIGLPSDPILNGSLRRLRRRQCKNCKTRWSASRDVCFCPQCATPTPLYNPLVCRVCHTMAKKSDNYCVACGNGLLQISS